MHKVCVHRLRPHLFVFQSITNWLFLSISNLRCGLKPSYWLIRMVQYERYCPECHQSPNEILIFDKVSHIENHTRFSKGELFSQKWLLLMLLYLQSTKRSRLYFKQMLYEFGFEISTVWYLVCGSMTYAFDSSCLRIYLNIYVNSMLDLLRGCQYRGMSLFPTNIDKLWLPKPNNLPIPRTFGGFVLYLAMRGSLYLHRNSPNYFTSVVYKSCLIKMGIHILV